MSWNFPEIRNKKGQYTRLIDKHIDFFLWVSHGNNVSGNNTFYPIKTDFVSISLYSAPYRIITSVLLENIDKKGKTYSEEVCDLVYGHCPKVPIENNNNPNLPLRYVYLPPLVFTGDDPVTGKVQKYVGLYHLKIIRNTNEPSSISPKTKCGIWSSKKILDNHNIYGDTFTYTRIFSEVKKYCYSKNIDYNSILLGIYSCQIYINYENLPYYSDIEALIPKIKNVKEKEKATILDNKEYNNTKSRNLFAVICKLPILIDPEVKWQTYKKQYDIKYQGCGIQLLEFFGIIDEGNEKIMCLPSSGTGIFDIVDYINTYMKKLHEIEKFMVIRLPLYNAIIYLNQYFVDLIQYHSNKMNVVEENINTIINPDDKFFIVLKLNNGGEKGHTIGIIFNNNEVTIIDVQNNIKQKISSMDQIILLYRNTDGTDKYQFVDIIMNLIHTDHINNIAELFLETVSTHATILNRKINGGGNIIQKGGNMDKFEELMTSLDKKSKLETALITIDVNVTSNLSNQLRKSSRKGSSRKSSRKSSSRKSSKRKSSKRSRNSRNKNKTM